MATLKIRSKLLLMTLIAVMGIAIIGALALYSQYNAMMQDRIDKTRNLVEVMTGTVTYYEQQAASGAMTQAQAQKLAREATAKARFDGSEYIFLFDKDMVFVEHPKAALVGKPLSSVKDPAGRNLAEIFGAVLAKADKGTVEYSWPKADGVVSDEVSYVMTSPSWRWVVGTGIYIDDVSAAFWRSTTTMLFAAAVGFLTLLGCSLLIARGVLRELGGEPAEAARIVKRIASGDLREPVRLVPGDSSSLLAAIADMQQKLRDMIASVVDSAGHLSSMSEDIARNADQAATSSEQQSAAASAMAASIEEMTVSISHIADHAQVAREQTQTSGDLSSEGSRVIGSAVAEIEKISAEVELASNTITELVDRTETISNIMNVISDVADQTNLLALNAAIEAARAGEQGRGFAVVADEVRKLAERTTKSTQEIATMISTIQQSSLASRNNIADAVARSRSGVTLAGQGGQAVEQIRDSASAVVDVVNDISHSLKEQRMASSDIAQHVERIAINASANAEVAKSTAAATIELHGLTDRLRNTVAQFQV